MVGIRVRPKAVPTAVPTMPAAAPDFTAVFRDAVDYLFPRVPPPVAALYMHILRHSVAETGTPYLRLSLRRLAARAVGSTLRRRPGARAATVSVRTIMKVLRELEAFGAIRQEAPANREGTLYRVFFPDEIAACRAAKRARDAAAARAVARIDAKAEVDFYNVRVNRARIFARDGWRCRYCAKLLTRQTATLDHVVPVSAGGGHGWDNLVTACLECNASKTARAVGDFLAERTPVPP